MEHPSGIFPVLLGCAAELRLKAGEKIVGLIVADCRRDLGNGQIGMAQQPACGGQPLLVHQLRKGAAVFPLQNAAHLPRAEIKQLGQLGQANVFGIVTVDVIVDGMDMAVVLGGCFGFLRQDGAQGRAEKQW